MEKNAESVVTEFGSFCTLNISEASFFFRKEINTSTFARVLWKMIKSNFQCFQWKHQVGLKRHIYSDFISCFSRKQSPDFSFTCAPVGWSCWWVFLVCAELLLMRTGLLILVLHDVWRLLQEASSVLTDWCEIPGIYCFPLIKRLTAGLQLKDLH